MQCRLYTIWKKKRYGASLDGEILAVPNSAKRFRIIVAVGDGYTAPSAKLDGGQGLGVGKWQ
jgi:hypothetical protein